MSFGLGRGLAAGAVTLLILTLAVPAAQAQEPGASSPSDGSGGDTLVERLIEAAESGESDPDELAEQLALPVEGAGSLTFDESDRLTVAVYFEAAPDASVLERIGEIGELGGVQESFLTATVRIDPARLGELIEVPGVLTAIPALSPVTGASEGIAALAGGTALASAGAVLPAANRPDGTTCGPIEIEADAPLRSGEARDLFGIDGTGVTVGIISDSFDVSADAVTSAADDVASGALPGASNPCERLTPVEVLSDGNPVSGSDEGRAMAQLVHGIAPGAKLLFASSGAHEGEMAQHIEDLVEAGADIIVDDYAWTSELTYQQGIISSAVNSARNAGVAYFTSAGNATGVGTQGASDGLPVSSWQTTAYRPASCPAWVLTGPEDPLAGETIDCLDFDPDTADSVVTPYDTLQISGAIGDGTTKLLTVGSLGEPLFGATTDYEWRYYNVDPVSGDPELIGAPIVRLSQYHPNFTGSIEAPLGAEIRMVLVRKSYDPEAPLPAVYSMFIRGASKIAERVHMGDGVRDWVGESAFGHAGDGSATSVASLDWEEPTTVRRYSSLGPATLLFEPITLTDTAPAARLAAWERVDVPHIASVDGVETTFFGQDEGTPDDPTYRFYGTSAAAPNAAAVAALALSYAPGLTGEELRDLVISTAVDDVDNPYAPRFDDQDVYGAGRIDAVAMLEALPTKPYISHIFGISDEEELLVAWEPGSADHFVISIYLGEALPENVIEASQLSGGTDEYTFTGLQPDTEYTILLTPYAEHGIEGETAELVLRTMSAGGGDGGGSDGDDESGAGRGGKGGTGALENTGSGSQMPWLVGAGALLLLGGGATAFGLVRRRRAGAGADTLEV